MHSLKISDVNARAYSGTELSENIAPDFCLLKNNITITAVFTENYKRLEFFARVSGTGKGCE